MTSGIPLFMGAEECGKGDRCGSGDVPVMFGHAVRGAVRPEGRPPVGGAERRPSLIRGSSGCAPATAESPAPIATADSRFQHQRSTAPTTGQTNDTQGALNHPTCPATDYDASHHDRTTDHDVTPSRRSTSLNDPSIEQSRAPLHWECAAPPC